MQKSEVKWVFQSIPRRTQKVEIAIESRWAEWSHRHRGKHSGKLGARSGEEESAAVLLRDCGPWSWSRKERKERKERACAESSLTAHVAATGAGSTGETRRSRCPCGQQGNRTDQKFWKRSGWFRFMIQEKTSERRWFPYSNQSAG